MRAHSHQIRRGGPTDCLPIKSVTNDKPRKNSKKAQLHNIEPIIVARHVKCLSRQPEMRQKIFGGRTHCRSLSD